MAHVPSQVTMLATLSRGTWAAKVTCTIRSMLLPSPDNPYEAECAFSAWRIQPRVPMFLNLAPHHKLPPNDELERCIEGFAGSSSVRALAYKDVGRAFARDVLRAFIPQSTHINVVQEMLPGA